jgi:hypothetical protein
VRKGAEVKSAMKHDNFALRVFKQLRERVEREAARDGLKPTEWARMVLVQACNEKENVSGESR